MEEQSRNVWIKQDDPKLVSSRHKDIFEDILEDRRHSSDLGWSLRTRDVPDYKNNKPRTIDQIKEHVMASDRVKYAVEQVCMESGLPADEVWAQAKEILEEMSHNLRLGAIRGFAVFLVKVLKALFKRIYVNEEGIQKVRAMIKEYPILLTPSHRSYFDFLLMSFVFYHYDLPLPVIAAAMDFMGMKFFGWLLRNSGAFYIRRSFGDDQLYWAVFTEYVQTQICNSDHPLEFYVEGTRSRTSKSYCPKFGMLSASLEPYFKAHIPDIMIIPISISYDKVLEEKLYAYELLGVPKPKESTSALFKARNILSEDFGNVHIHFGDPLSIREYSVGKVDRSIHNLAPRYIASLSKQETDLLKSLAYDIVLLHLKHMVISPWSMTAAVMVQNKEGIPMRQLVREVEWLKRHALNLGAYIDWPGNESSDTVVRSTLQLHKNIVTINKDDVIELVSMDVPSHVSEDQLMQAAAQHLMLSIYRNQLMHIFVRVAMVSLSINVCTQDTLPLEDLYNKYVFLEHLLNRDFIFHPGHTKLDFEHSLLTLTHNCGVIIRDNAILIKSSTNKYTTFFSQMFEPFLLGYWIVCRCLLSLHTDVHGKPKAKTPKVIAKEAQMLSARLLRDGAVKHLEVLSLDILNNGLHALFHMNAVSKEKRDGQAYMYPNTIVLTNICEQLEKFLDVPQIPMTSILVESKTVVINAKL
ncbi:dihydroxyacetone phosphate acyltransferase-like [Ylistrum balloti]|uniref:dihydroxyacetone phosphate acyltransferase-like n=1 Tax=Ylistrum balloti TaxID=509963 RepID=UPI002905F714|nr:dihydroxyacetone phosphate acyltransferase-like [Ylistrum balloti]